MSTVCSHPLWDAFGWNRCTVPQRSKFTSIQCSTISDETSGCEYYEEKPWLLCERSAPVFTEETRPKPVFCSKNINVHVHLTNWKLLCASVLWFVVFQTSTKGPFLLQGVVCVTLKDVGFMTWCHYVTILANHMWFSCLKVHGFVLHYGSICCFIP